jgi:hypothetical protein
VFQYSGTKYIETGTGPNDFMSDACWSFLSAGLPMTNEETLILNAAVKDLMSVF